MIDADEELRVYRKFVIEESVQIVRNVIERHRCCTDLADKIAAAIRALKDKP